MKLVQRTVTMVLSEDVRQVLEQAAVRVPAALTLTAYVEDADDLGIWIREIRTDGNHAVLVRWEYVLSVDVRAVERESIGLKA